MQPRQELINQLAEARAVAREERERAAAEEAERERLAKIEAERVAQIDGLVARANSCMRRFQGAVSEESKYTSGWILVGTADDDEKANIEVQLTRTLDTRDTLPIDVDRGFAEVRVSMRLHDLELDVATKPDQDLVVFGERSVTLNIPDQERVEVQPNDEHFEFVNELIGMIEATPPRSYID